MVRVEYGNFCNNYTKCNAYNSLYHLDSDVLTKRNCFPTYLSFDGNGIDLEMSGKQFYSAEDYSGYISADVSTENGNIENCYISMPCDTDTLKQGVVIRFYGECCEKLKIKCKRSFNGGEYYYESTSDVSGEIFTWLPPAEAIDEYITDVEFHFTTTVLPYQFIKIAFAKFGTLLVFEDLKSADLTEEISVLSDDFPINSFNFSIYNEDENLTVTLQKYAPLFVFSEDKYYGTYYIDDVERSSENTYDGTAYSCGNFAEEQEYTEWWANNNSDYTMSAESFFEDFKKDIAPISSPNELCGKIIGHIPIESYRQSLCKVAFAMCCMIDDSRSDGIVLRSIPTEITSIILTDDERIIGESALKRNKDFPNADMQFSEIFKTEDKTIEIDISGTQKNKEITYYFEKPVVQIGNGKYTHSPITKARGNYVSFYSSEDTAEFHTTEISYSYNEWKVINENNGTNIDAKNTTDFKNLNLQIIGDNNTSFNAKKALAVKKYIQSIGTVSAKIRLRGERVGDLIQIETAYDGIVTGIITSMGIAFGYEDIATLEVLAWT